MRRRVVARGIKEAAAERTMSPEWQKSDVSAACKLQHNNNANLNTVYMDVFLPTQVFFLLSPLSSRWLSHESMNIHLFIFFSYIMFTVRTISAECGLKFMLLVHFFWSRKLEFLSPRLNTSHKRSEFQSFQSFWATLSSKISTADWMANYNAMCLHLQLWADNGQIHLTFPTFKCDVISLTVVSLRAESSNFPCEVIAPLHHGMPTFTTLHLIMSFCSDK